MSLILLGLLWVMTTISVSYILHIYLHKTISISHTAIPIAAIGTSGLMSIETYKLLTIPETNSTIETILFSVYTITFMFLTLSLAILLLVGFVFAVSKYNSDPIQKTLSNYARKI